MRIAFLWDNGTHKVPSWRDGLWKALEIIKESHEVIVLEPRDEIAIHAFKPDVLLFWGALCEDAKNVVVKYPYKKAICFAGGPIEQSNVDGFDMYFVESAINEKELQVLGKPYMRAFGVNEEIFKPVSLPKLWDGAACAAFAAWKRPELFAAALALQGCWVGQKQDHEKWCYEVLEKEGVKILGHQPAEKCARLINSAYCVVNTASLWGGGQRLTLEAMACDIPVIVMSDSPKNCEYVIESGAGLIVEPSVKAIQEAVEKIKGGFKGEGRKYIESKWTGKHYADSLLDGITSI